ncbi:MAG: hypothetical protein ACRCTL_11000 [Pseudomonas sp.]
MKSQATKIQPPKEPSKLRQMLEGFIVGCIIGAAGAWWLVEYLA